MKETEKPKACGMTCVFLCLLFCFYHLISGRISTALPKSTTRDDQKPSSRTRKVKIVGPYLSREDSDDFTKVVLRNGLTVIVFERKDLSLVSIGTYVKAGYVNELDEESGIAHVMEHMFFKGTAKRAAVQIAKETKKLGGYLNAETFYDHTYYYAVLPAENFRLGLEIQADALQNPALPEPELKREIQVILQEARRKLDNPIEFSSEKLYGLAFETSPLRRGRMGEESTLLLLTRQQVFDFYKRWYIPSNIVLAVAGNVDRRLVLEEVTKRYGSMPSGQSSELTSPPVEPEQGKFKYLELRGDISQSLVQIGFRTPGAFTKGWYACKVLEAILTLGRTAILNRKLKEEKNVVSSVSSSSLDFKDQGYLSLTLSADSKKLNQAEILAFAELEKIKAGSLSEEDMERGKRLLERDYYLGQENLPDLALQLAHSEHQARYSEWRDYTKKIRLVTSHQVIQVARQYLPLSRCSVLEYQPEKVDLRSLSAESFLNSLSLALPRALENTQESEGLEGVLSQRNKPTPQVKTREKSSSEISTASVVYPLREYSILRGPDVLVKESHALPLISLGIFFPGGRVFEDRHNSGITELMIRTSIKGTQKLTSSRIMSSFENLGLTIELKVEPDFFVYLLTGLSENLGEAVETLLEVIKHPKFEKEEIEKEKTHLKADATQLSDSNLIYAQQLFLQALYGEHPYALPPYGSGETISNLTRDDIVTWHERFVRNAMPVLVIAGDTEGSSFAGRFSNQLSSSDLSSVDLKKALPVKQLDSSRERVETRGRKQTATVIGFLGPPADNPACNSLTVLENVVSGLGGRFFDELWEREGLAYTITASQTKRVLGGTFSCYMATAPENEHRAAEGIKDQLKRLMAVSPSDDELRRAKNYSVGIYHIRLQQRTEQVLEYGRSIIQGNTLDEIKQYPQEIQRVDQDMIRGAAMKYIDMERFAWGQVRGSAK